MKALRTLIAFLSIGAMVYAAVLVGLDMPEDRVIPFTVAWAVFVLATWAFWRPVWNTVSVVAEQLWGWVRRRIRREDNGEPS